MASKKLPDSILAELPSVDRDARLGAPEELPEEEDPASHSSDEWDSLLHNFQVLIPI